MKEALRNVTLRQLQIFMVAAEYESFARAAETLHLTQPAISMQMKRLAEMIGIELFAKSGRELKLTVAGKALLPYVRQVTQTLREAGEELDAINGLRHGRIKLGMVTTTQYFSPRLTEAFRKSHPEIELDITIANRRNIVKKLENNEIDMAIMGRTPKRLAVDAVEFFDHPYVIVAPPSHSLVGQKNILPEELMEETFLARESGSGTRMILDHFFLNQELNLQEFTSNESIKQGVMAGMGLAIISSHTIHLEEKNNLLAVLDVSGMPENRTWFILHIVNKKLSSSAEVFKSFMEKEAPEHMRSIFS
ncbi:MAG: LysR substrate-binding domain-containing protein [Cellvibrionaceae bacterium]